MGTSSLMVCVLTPGGGGGGGGGGGADLKFVGRSRQSSH